LAQSASSAASAANTAVLAVTQQAEDRAFLPTTQTALSDALTELNDAETSATAVQASASTEAGLQSRALEAIRTAEDAVLAAQRVVAQDAAAALPALRASGKALTSLSDELEKQQ
jgi:hypothetical protein